MSLRSFIKSSVILSSIFFSCSLYAKEFKVGWEPWEPYQFKDSAGKLTGLDVEIIQSALDAVGHKTKFAEAKWARVMEEVKKGGIDIALSAGKNKEREEFAYFSEPYNSERIVLAFRKGDAAKHKIEKLSDLKSQKLKIGILAGNTYGDELDAMIKNKEVSVETVTVELQNLNKLLSGRFDTFVDNEDSLRKMLAAEHSEDKVEIHSFVIAKNDFHFMLSKKSGTAEDMAQLNKGLSVIKNNGKLGAIRKKYLGG